jgi:Fungal Zn(2)-Cys(6) binuclear cluster domain
MKCDGVRPTCQQCERLGFECVYEIPETATNVIIRKDYLASLEDRVKVLEGVVTGHDIQLRRLAGGGTLSLNGDAVASPTLPPIPPEGVGTHVENGDQNQVVGVEDGHEPMPDENPTDGMAISFVDEKDSAFFGMDLFRSG